jgi:perosamine synthetase
MKRFSLHEPLLKSREKFNVDQCLETGWLSSSGNFVKSFEKKLEEFTNSNVICCNSGTSALHISLISAGVKVGDEVIAPSITFIATINAILYCGASPIFMDCDESLCVDTNKLLEFLKNNTYSVKKNTYNKKTKKKISAVMITHVFGNLTNLKELAKECRLKNIKLIEDAAESLGSYYLNKNIHSGTVGDYGILSFNVNKIITTGAGGAILFKKVSEKIKIKRLISQGKTNNLLFKHKLLGYNYGMPNTNAAIGSAQLENIEYILKKKKKINSHYSDFFSKTKNIKMNELKDNQKINNWLNVIKINEIDYVNFKKGINQLIKIGIDVRPVWYPCHKQNYLKKYETYKVKLANKVYKNCLCIPSSYFLKTQDLSYICRKIKNVFGKK